MTSGGAKRIMFPCVGLASRPAMRCRKASPGQKCMKHNHRLQKRHLPRSARRRHTSQAYDWSWLRSSITTAFSRPLPRTSCTMGEFRPRSSRRKRSPCTARHGRAVNKGGLNSQCVESNPPALRRSWRGPPPPAPAAQPSPRGTPEDCRRKCCAQSGQAST